MEIKYLRELYPPELLEFLRKIQRPQDVNLTDVNVEISSSNNGWCEIEVTLNGYTFSFPASLELPKQVGAAYYYTLCREAWDELAFLTFEGMNIWLESEYTRWIKNDTGHNIAPDFLQTIVREIERLVERFKTDN